MSTYPALIEELLNRHWSEEELQGVLRGNLLRVFKQVEQVCWAGQRSTQESEQVCWGKLWGLLTINCCLQVREENKGQRPLEDEFPDEQLSSFCRSVLPPLHQRQNMAPDQKLTETPMHWTPKLSLKVPFSKSSPHTAPGFTVIAAFPVLVLWVL